MRTGRPGGGGAVGGGAVGAVGGGAGAGGRGGGGGGGGGRSEVASAVPEDAWLGLGTPGPEGGPEGAGAGTRAAAVREGLTGLIGKYNGVAADDAKKDRRENEGNPRPLAERRLAFRVAVMQEIIQEASFGGTSVTGSTPGERDERIRSNVRRAFPEFTDSWERSTKTKIHWRQQTKRFRDRLLASPDLVAQVEVAVNDVLKRAGLEGACGSPPPRLVHLAVHLGGNSSGAPEPGTWGEAGATAVGAVAQQHQRRGGMVAGVRRPRPDGDGAQARRNVRRPGSPDGN